MQTFWMLCRALILVVIFFALVAFMGILYQHVIRPQPIVLLGHCKGNLLDVLSPALEKYRSEHNGQYPGTLTTLVPRYLKELPVCPATTLEVLGYHLTGFGGKDTYSPGYSVEHKGTSYELHCSGNYHSRAGEPPDRPALSSGSGVE